jgi:hypothetical protein
MKIWDSTWECVGSFPHTLESVNVIPRLHSRLAPFHAFALVAISRLGSWHLAWHSHLEASVFIKNLLLMRTIQLFSYNLFSVFFPRHCMMYFNMVFSFGKEFIHWCSLALFFLHFYFYSSDQNDEQKRGRIQFHHILCKKIIIINMAMKFVTIIWKNYIHLNIIYICDASQIHIIIFHIV